MIYDTYTIALSKNIIVLMFSLVYLQSSRSTQSNVLSDLNNKLSLDLNSAAQIEVKRLRHYVIPWTVFPEESKR